MNPRRWSRDPNNHPEHFLPRADPIERTFGKTMQRLTVELHSHTYHSTDSLLSPERLLDICVRKGIDRIAITDHNTTAGAFQAAALDPERVIIGEEIKTTKGELLGYFLQEEIPQGFSPQETISMLRDQRAFISVSHPFDHTRSGSWAEEDLRRILEQVDAIETYNARTWSDRPNRTAREFALDAGLLQTAGSDSHAPAEVGQTVVKMPVFHEVETFRTALSEAEILGRRSCPVVHLYSRYATWRKLLGWTPPGR
ncbi:MAG TPA: PHP-associated domain-containing protein [Anaerolineales bacterium]|nr:PHP-associated domain-containing protein [Anaerolineales bacterium]